MKKIALLFLSLCLSCSTFLFAQQSKKFTIPRGATVVMSQLQEDWAPVVQTIEQPVPGGDAAKLRAIKEELAKKYPKKEVKPRQASVTDSVTLVNPPYVAHNFAGNPFGNSTPNDNDIAVSNNYSIVSVQNTNVFRFNANTWTAQGTSSLAGFFGALGNVQSKYDPKVMYDPIADRFVILTLAGYTDSTSSILVGFSQTSDPSGAWNLYSIPGNPLNDTLWTDFPMISLTNNELFLTVNHLYNNMPWQTGFNRTVIWQINKTKGYNGQPLDLLLNHNINYQGKPLRNLCPVKGGSTLYGPDMYFLSERNLQPTNDTVFLVHVMDTAGSPNFNITVTPLISDINYFVPPSANQPTTTGKLATNDSRVLGAFYEDGMIQYVQNTLDTTSGKAAIIHGVITNLSDSIPVIHAHLITDSILEFGYPNLSYAGVGPGDTTTFISFLHSSATTFPGFSAMTWTGSQYSSKIKVMNGQGFINVLAGEERWGDYSGSQRKYNNNGEVWVNGMYGKSGLNHQHATWIAQLGTSIYLGQPTITPAKQEVSTFPNPFLEQFEVMFTLEKSDVLKFELYDIQGRLVRLLLYDKVKAGTSRFTFSGTALARGTYLLKIASKDGIVATKQIIKD
ncbi:MAG: T9SS type A sorting domain-containing protein [Bacteroidota bacterium]